MALLMMNDIPENAPFSHNTKLLADKIAQIKSIEASKSEIAVNMSQYLTEPNMESTNANKDMQKSAKGGLLPNTSDLVSMPGAEIPIPEEIVQQFEGYTRGELQEIDQTAVEVAHALKVKSIANQPYDTVSKVINERLKDLPVDVDEFFKAIGMTQARTAKGYMKYFKVLSVKGSTSHLVKSLIDIKKNGIPLQVNLFNEAIKICKRPLHPSEEKEVVDYLLLNPPDINNVVTYPVNSPDRLMDFYKDYQVQPPSVKTPIGAPQGFISCAPQFLSYGTSNRRTKFNPNVELAFQLFEEARASGIEPDIKMYTSLVNTCAEHRQFERAFAVYELLKRHSRHALSNDQEDDDGFQLTKTTRRELLPATQAKIEPLKPDQILSLALMKAAWKANKFEVAEDIMHILWSHFHVEPDAPMYNLIIRIAGDTANVEKAFMYYEQMQHFGYSASLVTYTSLIHACVQPDRPEFYPRAFDIFRECINHGFAPNTQLFNTLFYACASRADLNNALQIWRQMSANYSHLRDQGTYEIMLRIIGKTMNNVDLPDYGGVCKVYGSPSFKPEAGSRLAHNDATIPYLQDLNDKKYKMDHSVIDPTKEFRLSRAARLNMAETLFADFLLSPTTFGYQSTSDRPSNALIAVKAGTSNAGFMQPTPMIFAELIGVYANAAAGIMYYDRKLTEMGRDKPGVTVTNETKKQLIQRTWEKVKTLKERFPMLFTLNEHAYSYIYAMYGAADRLEDAISHFVHMKEDLNISPTKKTFNVFMTWCKRNRHLGVAERIFEEMKAANYGVPWEDQKFFLTMKKAIERPLEAQTFPTNFIDKSLPENRFRNIPRKRYGQKERAHPDDYHSSYKDW